jgi:hypothetical protein
MEVAREKNSKEESKVSKPRMHRRMRRDLGDSYVCKGIGVHSHV